MNNDMNNDVKMGAGTTQSGSPRLFGPGAAGPSGWTEREDPTQGRPASEAVRRLGTAPAARMSPSERRRGIGGAGLTGLMAALVSSLCCLPAAAAFALGLGGSAFLTGLGLYRPYFVVAGVGLAAVAIWWSLRRSRRCCSPEAYRRNRILVPAVTLVTLATSYALINLVLLPRLYGEP